MISRHDPGRAGETTARRAHLPRRERQVGDQNCPSNPATPVTVGLPSPRRGRYLRDGLTVNLDLTQPVD